MSTYLQLAQKLASESGTVDKPTTQLTTVVGATRRLAKVVRWTNDAWRSIQNAHAAWRWMQGEFSGQTVNGQRRYTATQLSIASRFGEWVCRGQDEDRWHCYLTATGVSDEGTLRYVPWDTFFGRLMRGTQTNGKPTYFSIAPDNQIALHPIPDAAYTITGPYRKDVQELTVDGDIPEMPTRFHDLIVDVAMGMLTLHDEAQVQLPLYRLRQMGRFSELERDQLPGVTIGAMGTFA